MKAFFSIVGFVLLLGVLPNRMQAQYLTIPDGDFAIWLQQNFPNCMTGNDLDTTCTDVTTATTVWLTDVTIANLTGIEYFDSLKSLKCSNIHLTLLPTLPPTLYELECNSNQLTLLPTLPNTLRYLYCYNNQITDLPTLPANLKELMCFSNQLSSIPALPAGLMRLACDFNQITALPALPTTTYNLSCSSNQLTTLPTLPDSLKYLSCFGNQLTTLPSLPNNLIELKCSFNQITVLPALPNNLTELLAHFNQLTSLPNIPSQLCNLMVKGNPISCLPNSSNCTDFYTDTLMGVFCDGHTLSGTIYIDANGNGLRDGGETGVANTLMQAIGNEILYSLSDENGNFTLNVDSASHNVVLSALHPLYSTLTEPLTTPFPV